jgi:YVTN family beta-propeller protein
MKRSYKYLLILGLLIALGLVIRFPGHKLARAHVNSKTAVDDHPLLCINCHLYTSKNKLAVKFVNEDYYSPFNLEISKDGTKLFIVAQESNEILVVDTRERKVIKKIKVGTYPHTIILDSEEKKAYVSNQWSDNVSVINLTTLSVVDTLKTGNGPAGLSLSLDNRFLYIVNSFSSDISVIYLNTGDEKKRFTAGNNPTGAGLSRDGKFLYVPSRRALIAPYGDTLKTELTIVDESKQRVSERRIIESAYIMENIDFTPTGDLAIMTLIRPKNLVPSIQVG